MFELSPDSRISCPNCATELDPASKFCNHCGFNLLAQSVTPAQETTSNNRRNTLLVAGSLTVLVAIAVVVALLSKNTRTHSDSLVVNTNQVSEQTMSARAQQIEDKILRGESLSQSDVSGLTPYELRVLRNVHFARYGRKYERPGLGDYFYSRSWYQPSESYSDTQITAIDKANINVILQIENAVKTPSPPVSEPPPPVASQPSPPAGDGRLAAANLENALAKWISSINSSGTARVIGIHESNNSARADIRFTNFKFKVRGFGGVEEKTFSGGGLATLIKYNDGRWILSTVYTNQGYDSRWFEGIGIVVK